jgi:hypothetical protein
MTPEEGKNNGHGDLNWITNFIWGIADDVLRDLYVRGKYYLSLAQLSIQRVQFCSHPTSVIVKSYSIDSIFNHDLIITTFLGDTRDIRAVE